MVKDLFGILVIVSVNVIKRVMLVNIYTMKIVNTEKKLTDKLVDECAETIKEVKLTKITLAKNEDKYKCNFCTLYIVLFSILFTINVGIGAYFVYFRWYLKKDVTRVEFENSHSNNDLLNTIFIKYKWKKLNKLTLKIELIIFTTT